MEADQKVVELVIVEEHLEMMQIALALFEQPDKLVCWAAESVTGLELSMMPRIVKDVLRERVFASRMPIVFSSATLSVGGSFDYAADNVGVDDHLSFSVVSSADLTRVAVAATLSATAPL